MTTGAEPVGHDLSDVQPTGLAGLPATSGLISRLGQAVQTLERESFMALAVATFAALLVSNIPYALGGDGWLLLVAGREIVHEGLPARDALTVWSAGERWIDQQWLAQLFFYAVASAGGIKAALLVNVFAIAAAFGLALALARALGGSARSTAIVGVLAVLVALPHTGLRAQSLSYVLFVGLLALLRTDFRLSPARLGLILALLVIWANLHGSAVLGAGVAALYGACAAARRIARGRSKPPWWITGVLLTMPWACLLASPYGLALVDYYRTTLSNPAFADLVGEWQSPAFPDQLPFLLFALGAVWVTARGARRLETFEQLVLLGTLLAAFLAVRNVVWFVLAAIALLPRALDAMWPERSAPRRPLLNRALVAGAIVVGVSSFIGGALRSEDRYLSAYPEAVPSVIARFAATDPSARIFANERFADWLLWREPTLAGRIAYDVRFELLSSEELRSIARWRGRAGDDWRVAADGYRIIVLDPLGERDVRDELLQDAGIREAFRTPYISILVRDRESESS